MIAGTVVVDRKTKRLAKRIKPKEIAVIAHQDLDHLAGRSLAKKNVKAVINVKKSISGRFPNQGPMILIKAGIIIIDNCNKILLDILNDGDFIQIDGEKIIKEDRVIATGKILTKKMVKSQLNTARSNINKELNKFIENTLTYARKEKELILNSQVVPDLDLDFSNRHVLVVVRGTDYREDLKAVKSYIWEMEPVIIAVDGGADTCLEMGFIPDIIVGDMDSISDKGLKCGSKLVVHAYPDGTAPGLKRVKELGLSASIFPAPGTSEDIALLLAYEKGAELITAVGTHTHMIDFLEKGRPGMASTMLVRLKIGDRLVDAKGLSKLYRTNVYNYYWLQILLAILIPMSILGIFSPPLKHLLQLLYYKINLIFTF